MSNKWGYVKKAYHIRDRAEPPIPQEVWCRDCDTWKEKGYLAWLVTQFSKECFGNYDGDAEWDYAKCYWSCQRKENKQAKEYYRKKYSVSSKKGEKFTDQRANANIARKSS